jgi:hypothetical protein
MPVGNAGPQPASVTAQKQSTFSAATEPAASGSLAEHDPAQSNFHQAFSSAVRDSTAPARDNGKQLSSSLTPQTAADAHSPKQSDIEIKPGDTTPAQTQLNGNQILATINPLISGILSSVFTATISGNSKASDSTVPLAPKEQAPSKSKPVPQSEPVDPKTVQNSGNSQNVALISSVTGILAATTPAPQASAAAPVLTKAGPTEQVSGPPDLNARELPMTSPTGVQAPTDGSATAPSADGTAPAPPATSAAHPSAQSAPPATDSLSFALLLHPKLTQGPITSTQSVPVVKQASDFRTPARIDATADQSGDTLGADRKIAAVAGPAGNPPAQALQPVRSVLTVADPLPTHASSSSTTASGTQQSSLNAAPQTRSSQDAPSSDLPSRGKTEPASDSNSAALSGFGDIAKPVIAAISVVPNASTMHTKPVEAVSGAPLAAQVLNAQNQVPPAAAKEVVVRLQGETGEAISVRLVDQRGQVQVAVRSSDPATANLLRQDLSGLTNNLDRAGWKPEILPSTSIPAPFVRETSQGTAHDGQNPQGHAQGTLDWNQQDGSRRRSTVADLWDEILTRQGT